MKHQKEYYTADQSNAIIYSFIQTMVVYVLSTSRILYGIALTFHLHWKKNGSTKVLEKDPEYIIHTSLSLLMTLSIMLFSMWTRPDCIGNHPVDYRLLLLGSLQYIRRSLTFDNLEEYIFVAAKVHRNFFFAFVEYVSTILYKNDVTNLAQNMTSSSMGNLFHQVGLHGCLAYSDNTHVGMQSCLT